VERTLDSCSKCIESRLFEKHSVVATGKKVRERENKRFEFLKSKKFNLGVGS